MDNILFERRLLLLRKELKEFAISLTGGANDNANDLYQETLLKILKNRDKYRVDCNLKAWAYTIMSNIHYNNNRGGVVIMEINSCKPGELPDYYDDEFERIEIDDIINHLSYKYRSLITMLSENYSYKEIVLETGLPMTTISNRIRRARCSLKRLMEYKSLYN